MKIVIEQEPNYKYVVTLMSEKLEKKINPPVIGVGNEMNTLLTEMKSNLKKLMSAGQIMEVKTILAQLEQLVPNDRELQALRKQLGMPALPPS